MTPEGSTHVDTAFTGTTSSFSGTAPGNVAAVAVVGQADSSRAGIPAKSSPPSVRRQVWPEAEHGRSATPWIRHRSTRADAAAHYRELAEHHVPEEVATEVERILVDGSDAVVLGVIRQTARPTGHAYRARFALHLTVADGLVTRHHVYEDSLAVAQACEAEHQ